MVHTGSKCNRLKLRLMTTYSVQGLNTVLAAFETNHETFNIIKRKSWCSVNCLLKSGGRAFYTGFLWWKFLDLGHVAMQHVCVISPLHGPAVTSPSRRISNP